MTASIQSTLYTANPSSGGVLIAASTKSNVSRDDLEEGYYVSLYSVNEATTYAWAIVSAPTSTGGISPSLEGTPSGATLLAPEGSTSRSAAFLVDYEGPYLIRLVVDQGLETESVQFVRLRSLTHFAALPLTAPGERRDSTGTVPVDASSQGWAKNQNLTLQRLLKLVRREASSSRIIYVDSNRGRDASNTSNDTSVVVELPGTNSSNLVETGVNIPARGHGDFSSINDAIQYALDAETRGEAALSVREPYWIMVQPGYYEEDLALGSFIHLVANITSDATTQSVIVRSALVGGVGTHRYAPQDSFENAQVTLIGLHLEVGGDSTQPVLDVQGGEVELRSCTLTVLGDDASQGAALLSEVSNPLYKARVKAFDCVFQTQATGADRVSVQFSSTESELNLKQCILRGPAPLRVNEDLHTLCTVYLDGCTVEGTSEGVLSSASLFEAIHTDLVGPSSCVGVDVFGSNIGNTKPADVALRLFNCTFEGDVSFSTAFIGGDSEHNISSSAFLGSSKMIFPDAPGDLPTTVDKDVKAISIGYDPAHIPPLLGPGGVETVPAANRLGAETAQEALDHILLSSFPEVGSPFRSLTSSYNGLATLNPPVAGAGLGRNILANAGAVTLQGASYPYALSDATKNGSFLAEGGLEVGSIVEGTDVQDVLDVGFSEMAMLPHLTGGGPLFLLGRNIWDSSVTEADRGFGGSSVVASLSSGGDAPSNAAPYHLHLRSSPFRSSGTSKGGNVLVVASSMLDASGGDVPGDVHLVAGSTANGASTAGSLYLSPGQVGLSGGSPGEFVFTGAGSRVHASLEFDNAYTGGVAGVLYLATPSGAEKLTFDSTETLTEAAAVVNDNSRLVQATEDGSTLTLWTEASPAGDVRLIGDSVSGTLIAALGGPATTFTAGSYGDTIHADVPSDGRLRLKGDLEVTGSILGASSGGLGTYVTITNAGSPYAVASGVAFIDVDSTAGAVQVTVPLANSEAARVLVVRVKAGTNATTVVRSGADTVGGATSLQLIAANGSGPVVGDTITLFSDGVSAWNLWASHRPPLGELLEVSADRTVGSWETFSLVSCILSPSTDITVTLNTGLPIGHKLTVKDENGTASGAQRIIITDSGASTFDGAATVEITTGYGALGLYKNTSGNWSIV